LLGELRRIESVDASVIDLLVEHVLAQAIDGGRAR
jgi:hypothetical protein